jgi:pSer/pThr/pTyr-binding forkhead associated (FHA) protein
MLNVLHGQAEKRQFVFTEGVIRIGRSADPTDDRGRPRFNDVAFLENDSPENRTVTRGHALIRFDAPTGEYRLFDEGSANGTRVVRGGNAIDVPKRDPVGLALRTGDEVQLGKAALRVRIGTPE